MKLKGLLACALVCALLGGVAGTAAATAKHDAAATAAAKKKPPKKKKPASKKKAAWQPDPAYDCAKYVSADRLTVLAGGWDGTYTLKTHGAYPDRASWGPGGDSACDYTPSVGYGDAGVIIYYGTKNAAYSYAGIKQTGKIRSAQNCAGRVAAGNPLPTDPRQCQPVAIPGLGDQAFAVFSYIMVLRGPMAIMISLPSMPDPTGNLVPSQDLLVSIATAIVASIPNTPVK